MIVAGFLRRYRELAGALGHRGVALGAMAGLLLVVAFAVAVSTVASLTRAKPYESATAELNELLTDVGGAGLALLSVVGTADGAERREETRARWRMASDRIDQFCGQERDDALLCERLLDSRAQIERDLPGALAAAPVELDRLTNDLMSLVRFLRAYGRAYGEQASEAHATVEKQRSLLTTLNFGVCGAMAASLVLFSMVARAATDNRRRRVAAETSAVEAREARLQLVEAMVQIEASEGRYRGVVDSMIDAVFTTDSSGVTYVSSAVTHVLGRPPEEIVGTPPSQLFHAEDMPTMRASLRALRREPGAVQTLRLRTGGKLEPGRWLEFRFTASGPAGESGHYPLIAVVRDIHAQVLLEQAQREDMMKLRSIVESSGALIALVDGEQRIVLANRTFLDGAGTRLEDAIGKRYEQVVDCGEAGEALTAWLAGEQHEAFAFDQVLGKGRGRRVVRVTASHVHDERGRVNYSLFLGVDETERRSAEVRAIDASRLATLGEMATGMAHEINQPLTVIQFAVDAIAADIEDNLHRENPDGYVGDAMRHVDRVRNQSQRAAAIVRRLQGFARRGDDVAQAFDAGEAIRVGVDLVGEQMRLARIAVDLDLPDGLPAVHGLATRLQQVVINLLINARDAISEARARGDVVPVRHDRIDVRAFHDRVGERLVIEIGDSGCGIPEHVLPRLFESFFTTKPKGTGLGLSISSEIIGEMKGAIAAENRPRGGALFRLSFPAVVRSLPAAA